MTPNPSLAALLDSAIARLAAHIMSNGQPMDASIDEKVLKLSALIRRANAKRRDESIEIIMQVVKSLEPGATLPILSALADVAPGMIVKMQQDQMIADRIRHIYKVAEMAQILSKESIRSVRGSIRAVQKRLFEVASK